MLLDLNFKEIKCISDIQPFVADKKEIRFLDQPNGTKIGCYLFMDSKTFDSVEALECRGIAFDSDGKIVSRPLHKFFNLGEKEWLTKENILQQEGAIHGIYEKIDGSMIATSLIRDELVLRSKKAFNSEVVKLANEFIEIDENKNIKKFMYDVAKNGMTAIFELSHPKARIVVKQDDPSLKLLHVRDNLTGKYVMLDDGHFIGSLINKYNIPVVKRFERMSISEMLSSLCSMKECEGYVIQFKNGNMVKVKCPWYLRLHRSISFLRERDIASLYIYKELDDVKSALVEAGVDLHGVNEVEKKLSNILSGLLDEIDFVYSRDRYLDRKSFAIKNKQNPLFGMIMNRYLGKDIGLLDWYARNKLKSDFSLDILADEVRSEAIG